MSRNIWGAMALVVVALVLPAQVQAQPLLLGRCTVDNLSTSDAAKLRVEWARKCALNQNVGHPGAAFNTGLSATSGGTLKDYLESDLSRNPVGEGSFTGSSFQVNNAAMFALYNAGPTSQALDTDGYLQWSRDSWRRKGRPLYPTFGTTPDIADGDNRQLFPHMDLANCRLYFDKESTQPAFTAFYVNGYCESACYTAEQKIRFADGDLPIREAMEALREDLITLTPDSTFDVLQLQPNLTYSYTRELRDAEHTLTVITARSGGQLRLTLEHPVINGEGRIVQAQTLKVGDALVKADGTLDPIVDIQKAPFFGKVYNLAPVTTDRVSNILVAQGYLVGSVRFQNDEVGYLNRIILYRSIPADVLPQVERP